ncbi:MAG: Do family serine endopeptidase [Hyphomicrobiaceae bacterium]
MMQHTVGSGLGRRRWRGVMSAVAVVAGCALISAQSPSQAQGPDSVAPVAERLLDAVVNISTTQELKGPQGLPLPKVPEGSPFEDFFKDFFDDQGPQGGGRQVSSLGSGFVIDPSGLIVTNNHVIADADEIVINFNDGSKLKVEEVLGRDTKTDLALLKVNPVGPLKSVAFGDSGKLRVGDWVMAIGNPFGLGGTVTVGIISAKKRDINSGPYDDFLQTDAAINKGNSGGPLFNLDGEVIGVNTAIISPTGGSIGIGFAVPSQTAVHVIEQLREFGETRRGWIGVSIQSVSDEIAESLGMTKAMGALVSNIAPDGPAAKAGLEVGDVIVTFDGQDVSEMRVLPRIVADTAIGKSVEVGVMRNGKLETFKVAIERLNEATEAAQPTEEETPPDATEPAETAVLLGLTVAEITQELRQKFGLSEAASGVVVVDADPKGAGAGKGIVAGDVIMEVTNEKVATPDDFASRVAAVKEAGRKSVLLLVSDAKGEIRFVAVPLGD